MNITLYKTQLRKLFPKAVIAVTMENKHIKYELKLYPSISEKQHEDAMPKIREIFGDTLIERYTEETGFHFYIYQSYSSPSKDN